MSRQYVLTTHLPTRKPYRERQSSPLVTELPNELLPEDAVDEPVNPDYFQILLVGVRRAEEQDRGYNEQDRLAVMILVDCLVGI